MEDAIKMNAAEVAADKAGVRIIKTELLDIATMLGLLVGFVSIISLVYGDLSLLP